jgi:parallel beta-helix repeat protein
LARRRYLLPIAVVVAASCLGATPAAAGPRQLGSALPALLPASAGRTFYVATTGSDRARGTLTHPWLTIGRALRAVRPGDTIYVEKGKYVIGSALSLSGTGTAPITLAAYPHQRPVIQAPPAASGQDSYALEITGSYLRIHGFNLQGAQGTSSADVYLEASAHNVEISSNFIHGSQDQGIFAERTTSDIQILQNRIFNNGAGFPGQHQSHGMYLEGQRDLVAGNLIYNQPHGFGLQIYPRNTDSWIVDNTVVSNGHSGIVVGGSGGVSGIVIRNNIFAFNAEWGIAHDRVNPTDCVADHNLLFGNADGPTQPGFAGTDFSIGNVTDDPMFVDPARGNYAPALGSPAAGAADPAYELPTDFNGRPRPAAPAIGAYEPSS